MISRIVMAMFVCLLVSGAATVAESNGAVIREIKVTLHNFRFDPDRIIVRPGEHIRFVVENASTTFHTFTIYRSEDDRQEPLVSLSMSGGSQEGVVLVMPDEVTQLYLACLPHETALNMYGTIVVTNDPEALDSTE